MLRVLRLYLKKLRGSTLRILRLYLKVAIFQPELQELRSTYYAAIVKPELRGCALRTTFVLKSCDFPA